MIKNDKPGTDQPETEPQNPQAPETPNPQE